MGTRSPTPFEPLAVICFLALAACSPFEAGNADRAPGDFTLEELVGMNSLVDEAIPQWSPDGEALAVVGRGALRTVPTGGGEPRDLPADAPRSPQYSPDGRWLAYIADRDGWEEIWLWSLDEEEAQALTRMGARISSFSWAPDGERITFSGNRYGTPDIFVVDVPDGEVRRLTSDELHEMNPTWTPDSRAVVFVRMDEAWVEHEILVVDADGGEPRSVIRETDFFDYRQGLEFGPAQVSPDGEKVLFRSVRNGYINHWVVSLEGGEPRLVWAEEADQPGRPPPFRGYARWSPDGENVAFTTGLNGTHVLRVAPIGGGEARTLVDPGIGSVGNLEWSPDGTEISYTLDSPRSPGDLWVVDVQSGNSRQLTHSVPDTGLKEALFLPEKISYESTDDLTIPALIYRPPPSAGDGPFPVIVWIHGGPTSQFDDSWNQNWQVHYYLKHGYLVFKPNIRGSSGYGLEWENLNQRCWGRCDMEDVIAGVEYLKGLPDVDSENIAVTGSSYGGYMSIAATTFAPGTFRASIPTVSGYGDWIRAAEDLVALAEVKLLEFDLGPLEETRDVYHWTSPIFHVENVDTPLLLVGAEGDTPMARFAQEVSRLYKPVRYIGMRDPGSPESRLDWMPETLDFLDMHLRGREVLPSP